MHSSTDLDRNEEGKRKEKDDYYQGDQGQDVAANTQAVFGSCSYFNICTTVMHNEKNTAHTFQLAQIAECIAN